MTLQIIKTGAKSWLYRYMVAGMPHGMGLGPVDTGTLAEALQKALEARKLRLDGINPLAAKKQNQIAAALPEDGFGPQVERFSRLTGVCTPYR